MNTQPFLSVDEVAALDALLVDARYEAHVDERAGRTHWAQQRREVVDTVQGVVDRHRSFVRELRETWEATA